MEKHSLIIYLIAMIGLFNVERRNMKKIIGIIHPFDLYQILYVYEDGNKIEARKVKVEDIPSTIFKLS